MTYFGLHLVSRTRLLIGPRAMAHRVSCPSGITNLAFPLSLLPALSGLALFPHHASLSRPFATVFVGFPPAESRRSGRNLPDLA